jgi:glycosyltransferase involved in cell wall biosynthesis
MNIIASAQMGPGTFEAKFVPLSQVGQIGKIFVLRKEAGPEIDKVHYIVLPKICRYSWAYVIIAPVLLLYYARKYEAKLILSYHVIPHSFFAYLASKVSGIPFSISQTGLLIQRYSERKVIGKLILHIFKRALFVNVPGTSSRQHWISKGIESSKIRILHSTISLDQFSNTNAPKKYDFIFMGRLAPEKNIELILKALLNLKKRGLSPSMAIVGEGPDRKKLETFVDSNELREEVTFTGFQTNVAPWLNMSEIFVMASLTEAMPTALMQAMACELVCISSNIGNIPDIINHSQNGFLFESDNLEELTGLMSYTMQNKINYVQLRKNARLTVIADHSHNSAVEKWNERLKSLPNSE